MHTQTHVYIDAHLYPYVYLYLYTYINNYALSCKHGCMLRVCMIASGNPYHAFAIVVDQSPNLIGIVREGFT